MSDFSASKQFIEMENQISRKEESILGEDLSSWIKLSKFFAGPDSNRPCFITLSVHKPKILIQNNVSPGV